MILIIGVGPAGLQAAIHAVRSKVPVTMLGRIKDSAMYDAHIENYFGHAGKKQGSELLENGLSQAISFGAVHINENVTALERTGDKFTAKTENGTKIVADAVIIASGISRKKLNIPGEKEFFGKGVSYCSACDCNFYKGKRVAIIGNDSEAAASAELMTKYASKVYWVTKETKASDVMIDNAVKAGAEILKENASEITGNEKVTSLKFISGKAIDVDGVFIELGARSSSDLAMDIDVMPDVDGTIKVNEKCETSVKGVYACGDVTGKPWQIAKVVGQGAAAGMNAAAYVKGEKLVR